MEQYFNIRYEFDKEKIHQSIDQQIKKSSADYICVADGVILNTANRNPDYLKVVNGGIFSICDSSFVPLYIKKIYGKNYTQYSGSNIFIDIVKSKKYRMIFLGTNTEILNGLKQNLSSFNTDVKNMKFVELPFCKVEDFDYPSIAKMIEEDGDDIIWIALGAPKQEIFMSKLKPYLNHGVMIAVGAAFKFFSGVEAKRAPEWMVKNHLEFIYRLTREPKKQSRRVFDILRTLPGLLYKEWRRSKTLQSPSPSKSN